MTANEFIAFYPQFNTIPDIVLEEYVDQANMRFDEFCESAEEARRLYVGHKLTLYAQTFIPDTYEPGSVAGMAALRGAGVAAQALSKSVGGASVSKSEGAAVSSISGFGEWKQTEFGLQLITLAKMCTAGVRYVP